MQKKGVGYLFASRWPGDGRAIHSEEVRAPFFLAQHVMRYRIGRLLQFLGLLILPFGIASELTGRVGLGQSLLIAAAGALVFYVGFLVQHRS
jgi:hypothetical protein